MYAKAKQMANECVNMKTWQLFTGVVSIFVAFTAANVTFIALATASINTKIDTFMHQQEQTNRQLILRVHENTMAISKHSAVSAHPGADAKFEFIQRMIDNNDKGKK